MQRNQVQVTESWASEASVDVLRAGQAEGIRAVRDLEARVTDLAAGDSSEAIDTLRADLTALNRELAKSRSREAQMDALSTSMQLATDELLRRQSTSEAGLAAVAARIDRGDDRLDLAEAGYLLRLANERLQLFGDPDGADLALQFADSQLDAMQDPLFLPVRRDIAESRQALASVTKPDVLSINARINGLQEAIPSWPFAGEAPVVVTAEPTEELGWWARFKGAFSGLVTVRRQTTDEDVLLSLEDKDYLRQGLWLQLETARLAVMRRDASTYDSALKRVVATLEQRFETEAATVSQAISAAAELSGIDIAPPMPDINTAWTRLQALAQRRLEAPMVAPLPAVTEVVNEAAVQPVDAAAEEAVEQATEDSVSEEAGEDRQEGEADDAEPPEPPLPVEPATTDPAGEEATG
jgi:uroporphyrin-3 C-methyltransferase